MKSWTRYTTYTNMVIVFDKVVDLKHHQEELVGLIPTVFPDNPELSGEM